MTAWRRDDRQRRIVVIAPAATAVAVAVVVVLAGCFGRAAVAGKPAPKPKAGAAAPGGRQQQQQKQQDGRRDQQDRKRRPNMTGLAIHIKPKHAHVFTGESLVVEVTLENTGDAEVDVPDPHVGSAFQYTLFSPADGRALHHLSAAQASAARTGDPPAPLTAPPLRLAPGGKQLYEDDLGAMAVPPLPPGAYRVTAALRTPGGLIDSPQADVTLSPPHVAHLASAIAGDDAQVIVGYVAAAGSGAGAPFGAATPLARPGDGPAFRRHDAADVSEVALALEIDDSEGVRWFAFRQGYAVAACLAQGKTVFKRVPAVPLGLRAPELHPLGWQPELQQALFVALGAGPKGEPTLGLVRISGATDSGAAQQVALAGAAPARWAVQYGAGNGGLHLDVVTAAAGQPPPLRVSRQTIALGATPRAAAPVTLLEHAGPLAALSLAPIARTGGAAGGVVDVLLGPHPGTGYMTFQRLPLAGGAARAHWDFSPPPGADRRHPIAWALASAPMEPPLVGAKAGDKIFVRRAGGDWTVLTDGAADASELRLEVGPRGRVVAIWTDASGVRYLPLP